MPVVVLVPKGANYEKVCSNMEEVIARGGRVIAVCSEGDHEVRDKVEVALEIPTDGEEVSPHPDAATGLPHSCIEGDRRGPAAKPGKKRHG
jgi:glucosamine 6-phosphate synthetase-like amidotransferase/phosphosugar isomerase protein